MPGVLILTLLAALQSPPDLDAYDLIWHTPGGDAAGSVPLGNGELGVNAWVEVGGDLLLLLARNDTFSEACRLLKIGRVRLTLDPPLAAEAGFTQTLHLREGALLLDYAGGHLEVFVEAERPIVRIRGTLDAPRRARLTTEIWRNERRRLQGGELDSSWTMRGAPDAVEVGESADLLADLPGAIGWFHRNESSIVPFTFRRQGLAGLEGLTGDPLLYRTFGAVAAGAGFAVADARTLATPGAVSSFELAIAAPAPLQSSAPLAADWLEGAAQLARAGPTWKEARARTAENWEGFWDRSWIFVRGDAQTGSGAVPVNRHPLRIGKDSNGQNLWRGEIEAVRILPGPDDAPDFRAGFTLEARVRRAPGQGDARIFDKLTAGGSDGFLFDTHPGHSLRLIVGTHVLTAPDALPDDGGWHTVSAAWDAATASGRIFCDGLLVGATVPAVDPPPPSPLTRAYALQRWIAACAGGGTLPIKFNGSIFTVEPHHAGGPDFDADWRRWGDCFWWQNTRLPYYPMLAAGDWDSMRPLFTFYEGMIPVCRARAKAYAGAEGAYFPETVTMFGAYANGDYGWDRAGHEASDVLCPWWQWAWNQGLELVALMLDHWDYTGDAAFAREELAPAAREVLKYFDTRFARDAAGRLVISPTQALETHWHGVVNDMPCVAGLHDVLPRLRALPAECATDEDRALWQRLAAALPPLPVREDQGVRLLAPAEKYDPSRQNVETPELYALFPFRLFALGRPGLELARAAYARRHDRQTQGWTQDGVFAARLGLVEEARANLLAKVANAHPEFRFPAMWGPNFDWLPDQCHGSNLMLLVQEMLLQTDGDRIMLFPAWPKDWDVEFKLHAPRGTVVEASLRGGKIERLVVTPEARRADLTLMLQ